MASSLSKFASIASTFLSLILSYILAHFISCISRSVSVTQRCVAGWGRRAGWGLFKFVREKYRWYYVPCKTSAKLLLSFSTLFLITFMVQRPNRTREISCLLIGADLLSWPMSSLTIDDTTHQRRLQCNLSTVIAVLQCRLIMCFTVIDKRLVGMVIRL